MSARLTHCKMCGKKLEPWQRRLCSSKCQTVEWSTYRKKYKRLNQEQTKATKPHELIFTPPPPRQQKYKSPISDEEQFKLNRQTDYCLNLETKVYQQGTPEWDDVVKKVIPTHFIPRNRAIKVIVNEDWRR